MSAVNRFEDLSVGQSAERIKTVTEKDVQMFAEVSGDHNPVHLDEAFAQGTQFRTRIAHGILTASHISAALAEDLPGRGCIYLSQTLKFKRPVKLGDEVTTRVEIAALDSAKRFVTLTTVCSVGGKAVIEGEAMVLVPA